MCDREQLIDAVLTKRPIWDKTLKSHTNRSIVDKCWKEISLHMKEDENKLRKQWKYLRDQFAVELGKFPQPSAQYSTEDTPISKWPYFTQLLFLKNIVKARKTGNSSTTESNKTQHVSESGNDNSSHAVDKYNDDGSNDSSNSKNVMPNTAKRKRTVDESIERDYDDEHVLFFKSLLPHVRKISSDKVLQFRSRVMELVDQFSHKLETPLEVPSPGYVDHDTADDSIISVSETKVFQWR